MVQSSVAVRNPLQAFSPLLVLIVPLAVAGLLVDWIGGNVLERIATTMFINLVLVLGLQVYMGNSGNLSFAYVGFMGIGAYLSSILSMAPSMKSMALPKLYPFLAQVQLPFFLALLVASAFVALLAAAVGYPLMRLSDAAAVITSFAVLVVIHTVLVHWDRVTNGPRTFFGVTKYTTLWTAALVAFFFIVLAYWFKESALGLRLRASRDDELAASSVGIDVVKARWAAFTLSAFMAAVGGGLWAHFITSFSPAAFYLKETFVILGMLVVGGPLTVSGAVIGTVIVTAAFEALRAIENQLNIAQVFSTNVVGTTEIFLSILLILILIFRPMGITGAKELLRSYSR